METKSPIKSCNRRNQQVNQRSRCHRHSKHSWVNHEAKNSSRRSAARLHLMSRRWSKIKLECAVKKTKRNWTTRRTVSGRHQNKWRRSEACSMDFKMTSYRLNSAYLPRTKIKASAIVRGWALYNLRSTSTQIQKARANHKQCPAINRCNTSHSRAVSRASEQLNEKDTCRLYYYISSSR